MFPRAVFLLILTAAPLPAEILFADNFDHSGALHGAAPDTRPGSETWIASGQFAAAGSVTATPTLGGSATLAFTPVNGRTYTLDARFSATAAASGPKLGLPPGDTHRQPFRASASIVADA